MIKIAFFILLMISMVNAKEYVDTTGWKVIYNPSAIDQDIFNSVEFRQFSESDQKLVAEQYFKENVADISPAYNSLNQKDKNDVYKQYVSDVIPPYNVYIQYKNITILFITAIIIGVIIYKRKSLIQLYQWLKPQSVALKRFSIIFAVVWIIMNHLDFWEDYTFRFSGDRFNEYFMVTYMPIIIICGIYWIISGIKKES